MIAWILFALFTLASLACIYASRMESREEVVDAYALGRLDGYAAGYADALGEAMDASRVICRQAWMHSEWERN